MRYCFAIFLLSATFFSTAQDKFWHIEGDKIVWVVEKNKPHSDHIEMSGEKVSLWMQYSIDSNKRPQYVRTFIFPTFRLLPAGTTSHMMYSVTDAELPRIIINNRLYQQGVYDAADMPGETETVQTVTQNGIMEVVSRIHNIRLKRYFLPAVKKALALEKLVFINDGTSPATVEMEARKNYQSPGVIKTKTGPYQFVTTTVNAGIRILQSGDSAVFAVAYQAVSKNDTVINPDTDAEIWQRSERINHWTSLLQLQTPDTILNSMFSLAKIRGAESIFNTKTGYLHSPGGLRYYAAIWANDQAEYINPFFGYYGDTVAVKSAMNAFQLFARYVNPEYKPIPSSIVDEGDGYWNGAGDRGDMAMIAYGAGRFALAYGNADSAKKLWPLIEWCLEYCNRKFNSDGVVSSDKDELEGRFPAGDANLNTSCLYYDALISATYLCKELGVSVDIKKAYQKKADALLKNINKYFAADVEGYATYRYYAGNTQLRSWIATPLVMNIFSRKEGTINALFSNKLWTDDGLATQSGDKTFWDRSTLYGLRGTFAAGATEKAFDYLKKYSERRLLGEHVPYAVEAYPEGNQRHLSAESGLYCRIFIEGILGLRPIGFKSFSITPHLPAAWQFFNLKNINAFGTIFNIDIKRTKNATIDIDIYDNISKLHQIYHTKNGDKITITLR